MLRASGLVTERRSGRLRLYSLRARPLRELFDWASLFSDFWSERMTGLHSYLDRQAQNTPVETGRTDPPGDDDDAS